MKAGPWLASWILEESTDHADGIRLILTSVVIETQQLETIRIQFSHNTVGCDVVSLHAANNFRPREKGSTPERGLFRQDNFAARNPQIA